MAADQRTPEAVDGAPDAPCRWRVGPVCASRAGLGWKWPIIMTVGLGVSDASQADRQPGRPAGPEPPSSESERLLNLNLEAQSRSADPPAGLTLMGTARA